MNKTTIIIALLVIGVALVGGYFVLTATDGGWGTQDNTATPDALADQASAELISETSTVEIGDMV